MLYADCQSSEQGHEYTPYPVHHLHLAATHLVEFHEDSIVKQTHLHSHLKNIGLLSRDGRECLWPTL